MNTIEPDDKKAGESAEESDESTVVDGDIVRNVLRPMDDDAVILAHTPTTVPLMTPIRPVNHPEVLRNLEEPTSAANSNVG